ncbi:hypothetical protein Vadar_025981 [Vaccinium darrowii]|uniref:Uncharacterized protein n=1 Tax=Vaccinium darrowii TaxID=229202 RepID=A0ACB7YH97_9ERIC|nr:hypothetical protein Vadar_025981 [Vaccinium darrowii]
MGRKPKHGPSFFKILIGEEFEDKLRIPPAFVTSNLAGQLPAKALIKPPNDSRSWAVEVKKTGDKNHYSFIRRGWRKFVEDCGLQAGDFVVFKLISNWVFEIVRYGPDGCEKELTINPVSEQIKENPVKARTTRSVKSEEAPAQASSGDSLPTNHPRRGDVNFPFAVTDRVIIKGNKRTPQCLVGREAIVTTRCSHGWYVVKTLDNPESVKLQYSSLVKVSDDPSSSKPSTGPNTGRSSRIVAEASGSRKQTEYPSFDAVIGKVVISNYYRSRLTLPMAFARGTGMATKRAVVLKNEEGRVWPVDISTYPSSRGRIDLSGGWPAFLKENNIVLGDSCVFKFIPSAGNVIDVVVQKGRRRLSCLKGFNSMKMVNHQCLFCRGSRGKTPTCKRCWDGVPMEKLQELSQASFKGNPLMYAKWTAVLRLLNFPLDHALEKKNLKKMAVNNDKLNVPHPSQLKSRKIYIAWRRH